MTVGRLEMAGKRGRVASAFGAGALWGSRTDVTGSGIGPDQFGILQDMPYTINPAVYWKVPYDPVDGIQPIILLGTTGLVMVVHPAVRARTVIEFIADCCEVRGDGYAERRAARAGSSASP